MTTWQIHDSCSGEGCSACRGQGSYWSLNGKIIDGLPGSKTKSPHWQDDPANIGQIRLPEGVRCEGRAFLEQLSTITLKRISVGLAGESSRCRGDATLILARRDGSDGEPVRLNSPIKDKPVDRADIIGKLYKMHPNAVDAIAKGKNKSCQGIWQEEAHKLLKRRAGRG